VPRPLILALPRLSRFADLRVLALLLASLCGISPGVASAADSFTPAQRAEIVAIVRDALQRDPSILRSAIDALQNDNVDRRATAAHDAIMANQDALLNHGDPVAGNPAGDLTIVEFFDPRCPYCRQINPALERMVEADHGIRLIYKDLAILGAPSQLGSRALLAADKQGGYRTLRAAMMSDSPDITDATIANEAQRVGLDVAKLQRDMQDPAIQRRLNDNVALAQTFGIEGTPAFVVGQQLVVGSELTELQNAISRARADHQAAATPPHQ
jgi:protein-disulfide isomerase